jgi:Tol biopolymer transport system component
VLRRIRIVAVPTAIMISVMVSGAHANFPGHPGRIAFSAGAPGPTYAIRTVTPKGTGLRTVFTHLSASLQAEGRPAYSADGSVIAFALDHDIYLINSDGSGLRQVTVSPGRDSDPSFSPDGSHIVFSRAATSGSDIYTVAIDGSGLTQLTTDPGNDYQPTWSPNGRLIAFVSNRSGSSHVWLMRSDGSYQHLLVPDNPHRADGQVQPEFAPSGARLVVSRGAHLMTMRLNGTHRRTLNRGGILISPVYSPDGRRIAAIEGFRGRHNYSLVVISASDGSHKRTIRSHISDLYGVAWQPLP